MATRGVTISRQRLTGKWIALDRRLLVYAAAFSCIPLAFIVYWPQVNDFFVFDDYLFLGAVRNHTFPGAMARAFRFTDSTALDPATLFWRPLIDVYFYAAKPLGVHAQPFHAANFLLHGLVGTLAIILLYRLTRSGGVAAATGLLFVVAPTYDFAVSWISQVSELLGYVFILTALIAYHEYLTAGRRVVGYAAVTLVSVVFALLTKESTVILAVLVPALAFAISPLELRRSRSQVVKSLAVPLAMIAAFAIAMQLHEYSQPDHVQSIGLHMARNLWRYLEWIVLPYRQDDFLVAREALAALFLIAGIGSMLARQRVLSFLFVWTIVAIVPYIGFDEWIELRYTYLATLPFIAFVVVGLEALVQRLWKRAIAPACGLLGAALMLALIVAPLRTRDEQAGFADQSLQYKQAINAVRNLCGSLSPESHVFVVGGRLIDLYGVNFPPAMNLYYHHIYAAAVPELPPLAAFIADKCVIQYDAQTRQYVRIG